MKLLSAYLLISTAFANNSPFYTDYTNTDWVETRLTDSHLENYPHIRDFYNGISNMYAPTHQDYISITNYFSKLENRPYLKWLNTFNAPQIDYGYISRCLNMQIWNKNKKYTLNREIYNADESTENVCIVCYSSINYNTYDYKIKRLKNALKKSNYKGHLLYQEGGWPDVNGGSLYLIHVPYSFKISMIKEAYSLGYRKIIWFDTSVVPIKNFDEVIKLLDTYGYLFFYSDYEDPMWNWSSIKLRNYFQISEKKELSLQSIPSGIIGFNFKTEIGRKFFNYWYGAAVALDPYLTPRPDQALLPAIADQLNIHCEHGLAQNEFFDILR